MSRYQPDDDRDEDEEDRGRGRRRKPADDEDESRPASGRGGGAGRIVHWVLTGLFGVVAVVALAVALIRDPLGAGLGKYDFSTPRAAYESRMKIDMNKDVRAMFDLEAKVSGKKQKEKLDTLEISREAEHRGKKLLFIAYKRDGVRKQETVAFEKDADSGFWLPSYLSAYEVEKDNKTLSEEMRKWESDK